MTSTSSEPRPAVAEPSPRPVTRPVTGPVTGPLPSPAGWTRLGSPGVHGDAVTEGTLDVLARRSAEAGRAQGFAVGWAEGLRAARTHAADRHAAEMAAIAEQARDAVAAQQAAARALEAAVARAEQALAATVAAVADQAVELGLAVAEAVLDRELAVATDPGADALRRALASVPLDVAGVARLHPADHAALDTAALAAVLDGRPVTVVPDPALTRGDAVVETDTTVVDARVGEALDRVRAVLAP